ncbi:HAD-IA family hydrolase [Patescibacteria group bacterium]|nr:HAD-IA family hydrolase [Patescibacteria group bacterium]
MKTKIKFVYFDIGGVALNFYDALKTLAKHVDRSEEHILKVFNKYDDDVCVGKMTPQAYWDRLKQELDLTVDIENFLEWLVDRFIPHKEVHELMMLVSKHYKIGLLTNIYEGTFVKIINKGHVPQLEYATIVQSFEQKKIKPDKEIFIYAQELAGVKSKEIFFIDDTAKNINQAKQLGWNTFLFDAANIEQSIKQIKQKLKIS